jgi:hypothetical protein
MRCHLDRTRNLLYKRHSPLSLSSSSIQWLFCEFKVFGIGKDSAGMTAPTSLTRQQEAVKEENPNQ